jgi:hypothetical protein
MKKESSTIIDFRSFVRRRDLHPGGSGSVGKSTFSRYGLSDLALPDRSWIFSHGCREKYYPRNICPDCCVLDNGDSCSWFPSDVDQAAQLLFSGILVLVLLPMVIDYFGIAAQIKIMGEYSLVFSGLWFGIYFRLPPEK